MKTFDLDFVRSNFPAFTEPSLKDLAFFENAGGSYACRQTIDWLERYYRQTKVQPYASYKASATAGDQMDQGKQRMADWLNVSAQELHFGPSTSANTYFLSQALRQELKPGDEVIVPAKSFLTSPFCFSVSFLGKSTWYVTTRFPNFWC